MLEAMGSIPSTHISVHNSMKPQFKGILCPLLTPAGPTCMWYIEWTCRQNTHTHTNNKAVYNILMVFSEFLSILLLAKQLVSLETQNQSKPGLTELMNWKVQASGVWVKMIMQTRVMSHTSCPWQPQYRQMALALWRSGVLGFWDKETIVFPRDLMKPLTYVKYVNTLEEKARGRK